VQSFARLLFLPQSNTLPPSATPNRRPAFLQTTTPTTKHPVHQINIVPQRKTPMTNNRHSNRCPLHNQSKYSQLSERRQAPEHCLRKAAQMVVTHIPECTREWLCGSKRYCHLRSTVVNAYSHASLHGSLTPSAHSASAAGHYFLECRRKASQTLPPRHAVPTQ